MNVSLTPDLQRLIREKVESGMYGNGSEVVREALRLYFERERKREWFNAEIQKGLDSAAAGNTIKPTDEYWNNFMQEVRAMARERQRKAG